MVMFNSQMDEAIESDKKTIAKVKPNAPYKVRAHAFNNVGTARLFLGQQQGIADLQESLQIALKPNMHEDAARAFTNLSEHSIDICKFDLAEKALAEGISLGGAQVRLGDAGAVNTLENARADALSRSQRMIEHHVSAILPKMEVENGMAVILLLQKEPWLVPKTADPA